MIYSTAKLTEQVNRNYPLRNTILQLSPAYTDFISWNSPPLEPYVLVPSGKWIQTTLWRTENCTNLHLGH